MTGDNPSKKTSIPVEAQEAVFKLVSELQKDSASKAFIENMQGTMIEDMKTGVVTRIGKERNSEEPSLEVPKQPSWASKMAQKGRAPVGNERG
jgi:hypothetical protein